jgi:hypothetical protein
MSTPKKAQGRFVLPGEAPEIEAHYAHVDALARISELAADPGGRDLERLLALPDTRETT